MIGAILRWTISDSISGIDAPLVGLILLGAGVVWLVLELILGRPRTQIIRERTDVQGPRLAGGP